MPGTGWFLPVYQWLLACVSGTVPGATEFLHHFSIGLLLITWNVARLYQLLYGLFGWLLRCISATTATNVQVKPF